VTILWTQEFATKDGHVEANGATTQQAVHQTKTMMLVHQWYLNQTNLNQVLITLGHRLFWALLLYLYWGLSEQSHMLY
jgi:hypothetical protein